MKTYSDKLKDPRWQKKRLEVMERDGWKCSLCGDTEGTLSVHHWRYERGRQPWEYPNKDLSSVCESCHDGIREFAEFCRELPRMVAESTYDFKNVRDAIKGLLSNDGTRQIHWHGMAEFFGSRMCLESLDCMISAWWDRGAEGYTAGLKAGQKDGKPNGR